MWASSVPDALDALVAAFRAAPGLEGVRVFDGPVVTQAAPMEALCVGFSGDPTEPAAAQVESAREGLSVARSREQYPVQCAASVLNGKGDISAARRRAYELYAVAGAVLAADPTLGRTVLSAQPGGGSLVQDQTPDGAVVTVAFAVDIDAFTRR